MRSAICAIRTVRPGFVRAFTTSHAAHASRWVANPAPPRLPKEEQEIFERLQEQSTGAFSTPRQIEPEKAQAQEEEPTEFTQSDASVERSEEAHKMLEQLRERARVVAKGDGEELHPNVRRGAAPEFQGDINPKTGEVGGPKNEPLRWGVGGDWSYNGRVTDF